MLMCVCYCSVIVCVLLQCDRVAVDQDAGRRRTPSEEAEYQVQRDSGKRPSQETNRDR